MLQHKSYSGTEPIIRFFFTFSVGIKIGYISHLIKIKKIITFTESMSHLRFCDKIPVQLIIIIKENKYRSDNFRSMLECLYTGILLM